MDDNDAQMNFEVTYNNDEVLGVGSFGTVVYKGSYNEKLVAVKVFPYVFDIKDLETTNSTTNQNVIHVLKVITLTDQKMVALLDVYSKNLQHYLQTQISGIAAEQISKQILDGVNFLHKSKIIHGNLCPSNVLLNNAGQGEIVVISDHRMFELMGPRWNQLVKSSSISDKTEWMAPEILEELQNFEKSWTKQNDSPNITTTYASDVFSVGCLFYYVATNGCHLFGQKFFREDNILKNNPMCNFISPQPPLFQFVQQMIAPDPSQRPELTIFDSFCWEGSLKSKELNESKTCKSTSSNLRSEAQLAKTSTSTPNAINVNMIKMEQWQRLVIKRHLHELVDLTSCNYELLTRLFSTEILTQEEINEIDVTENPKKKAYKLYELLVTRKNFYHLFLSACKEIRQTGVVSILENGESQHKLLSKDKCNVNHPSPVTKNSAPESILDKIPLLKTSSTNTEESPTTSNVHPDLSGHQQHNLSEVPNSSNIKSCSEALPTSSISHVDKIPSSEDKDQQSSNVKGAFQSFHSLTQNPQQHITASLEKCEIKKPNYKTAAFSDASANTNLKTIFSIKNNQQLGLKADISNKHHGDLSKLDSNVPVININKPDNDGRTVLHRSLADGQCIDVIKNLIDNKADLKLKDKIKQGVFHFAVRGGNKDVIKFLISFKLDINEVDEMGETPLHKVTFTKYQDYLGMATFLLDNGANLLAKDKDGNTVAHCLAYTEYVSCSDFQIWVEGMIKSGHSHIFAIRGFFGRTPLQAAMQRLDLDLATLKLILESSKVDIDQQDDNGSTLLDLALNFGRSLETMKNLISLGANFKLKDEDGNGVLHFAVNGGNKEVIQYLISQGLDVNAKNIDGITPLHYVRQTRSKVYVELTKLLLENGADLYSKNIDDNTLAHELAIYTNVSCEDFKIWVTAMIENGHAHLFTIRGQFGRTPLHSSMQEKDLDLETIKLIIESAKLDINQPDDYGDTILHSALEFGRSLDTIKSLVELGADWKRKGMANRSVLHSAVMGSNKESFLYFKSLGADVNAKDKYGEIPLHSVRRTRSKDYLGMTKFLLENGANLNAKDKEGKTLDHWMSSCDWVSAKEYGVWKDGIIQLGHAEFFQKKSFLNWVFKF